MVPTIIQAAVATFGRPVSVSSGDGHRLCDYPLGKAARYPYRLTFFTF